MFYSVAIINVAKTPYGLGLYKVDRDVGCRTRMDINCKPSRMTSLWSSGDRVVQVTESGARIHERSIY